MDKDMLSQKSEPYSRGAFKSPEPIKKGPASQHCLYKYTCWRNLKFVHVKKSLFSVPIRGSNLLIASFLTPMHSLYKYTVHAGTLVFTYEISHMLSEHM